jgi:hypothetical protein
VVYCGQFEAAVDREEWDRAAAGATSRGEAIGERWQRMRGRTFTEEDKWYFFGRGYRVGDYGYFVALQPSFRQFVLVASRIPWCTPERVETLSRQNPPQRPVSVVSSSKRNPVLPDLPWSMGAVAEVTVLATITIEGRSVDPCVLRSEFPGIGLEASVIDHLRRLEYRPAREAAGPVESFFTFTARFDLMP